MISLTLLFLLVLLSGCFSYRNKTLELVEVVMVRYKEALDPIMWMKDYPHTLYNRGGAIPANLYLNVVNELENVGREAFVYLKHIVQNYDNLPQLTIFVQAHQFHSTIFNNRDVEHLIYNIIVKNVYLKPHHDGFAFLVNMCGSSRNPAQMADLASIYGQDKMGIFTTGYKDLLNFEVDNPRFCSTSAILVSRDIIYRNSVEYYIKLARVLGSENDPIEGHFFERAWPEVFHSNCSRSEVFYCFLHRIVPAP